jgi:hypothetical protein
MNDHERSTFIEHSLNVHERSLTFKKILKFYTLKFNENVKVIKILKEFQNLVNERS